MTATANVTEIRCDGPGGEQWGCPTSTVETSATLGVTDLRAALATRGWDTFREYDLPPLDRCPACGPGTA